MLTVFLQKQRARVRKLLRAPTPLEKLKAAPRYQPGRIQIAGWDLEYVDGPSLASSIEVLDGKGWNDFKTMSPAPYIVDCGANVGVSVLRYKRLFPKAKIVAFEPDPDVAQVLRTNLKRNGADQVEIVEAAVWVENGSMPFWREGSDGSRIVAAEKALDANVKTVKTVDIASYLSTKVDLLKIDIEGAETDVVPHLANRLDNVANVIVECHVRTDEINRFVNVLDTLGKAKFEVAVNSTGLWRDLIHRPPRLEAEFDQYFIVAAWR